MSEEYLTPEERTIRTLRASVEQLTGERDHYDLAYCKAAQELDEARAEVAELERDRNQLHKHLSAVLCVAYDSGMTLRQQDIEAALAYATKPRNVRGITAPARNEDQLAQPGEMV